MTSFTRRNQPDWDELEGYLQRSRKSVRGLTSAELLRMETLYRRVTVQLAQVASRTRDQKLRQYLNQLCSQAHAIIYLPPRKSLLAGGVDLVCVGFARVIARHWLSHLVSLLLLLGGVALGYFASMNDRAAAYALLPAAETRTPGATREQLLETLRGGRDQGSGEKFFFASFLFQNNFKVGLMAMAAGVLAAIPTIFMMLYNGMMLGAFAAVHNMKGINAEMWAWLLPHGVTELGAAVLCGGIGISIGHAMLHPRGVPRLTRLTQLGHDIGITAGGLAGMMIFAAIIESYLRQSYMSTTNRLIFAAGTVLFWIAYISWGVVAERRVQRRSISQQEMTDVVPV